MKKIIIGLMVFFNVGISISNHQATVKVGTITYAQHQGEIWCNSNTTGNGADPSWWNTYTSWIQVRRDEVILSLGELYEDQIGGAQLMGNYYLYRWGQMNSIPYIETYYNGYGYYYFETPSIYGGPYRGGRMMNCSDGTSTYIDCAYLEHNTSASGISGTTADIAYLDECNECVGGNTGLPACSSPLYYTRLKNGDTTRYYDGDTITIETSNDCLSYNWPEITLYNEHGVPPPYIAWTATCNPSFFNGWFGPNAVGSFEICNVGNYTITVDSGSMLSHSTIFTNYLHVVPRLDTIKPTIEPCPPDAVHRDSLLTSLLNSMESKPEMINLRDSAPIRKFEVGFTINKTIPYGTPVYIIKDYIKTGSSRNVRLFTYTNSAAMVHTHNPVDSNGNKNVDGPSGVDIYNAISVWNYWPLRNFLAQYVISGDTNHHDYAIAIADTNLVRNFFIQYPSDTFLIDKRDSILKNGIMVLNSQVNNWKGNIDSSNTFSGKFWNAYYDFIEEGYPKEYCEDYANVYMMHELNMGTKMYRKVNGEFKELNFYETTDANGKKHKKIKICP